MPERVGPLWASIDALAWFLPGAHRLSEASALARQLPVLQAGVRAGHDLPAAARQAACVATNYFARRRLRYWAADIEAGQAPGIAAARAGFPRALRRALAGPPADLPVGLEYVAGYYGSLRVHWQRVLVSALVPIAVLLWGLVAAYIVTALYLPLVALIDSLVESIQ
jgi:type II secretory pathway component PulF